MEILFYSKHTRIPNIGREKYDHSMVVRIGDTAKYLEINSRSIRKYWIHFGGYVKMVVNKV